MIPLRGCRGIHCVAGVSRHFTHGGDSAALVYVQHFNLNFLSFRQVVRDVLNTSSAICGCAQAVFAGRDGDKCTEADTRHLTGVDLAFCLSRDRLNHFDRRITRRRVLTKDFDRAVIIDVDSYASSSVI